MGSKPIQEQFGEQVIRAFADFARSDLKSTEDLQNDEFSHISDSMLKRRLAEVFYGVRWIYKLGLALLTVDVERAAHVRAQIVDYAAITEGLLSHCLAHAIRRNHTRGTSYHFSDPMAQHRPINWNAANPEAKLNRQSYWWFIHIAREFRIISPGLERELQWLREQRNTVHLRQRSALGRTAFLQSIEESVFRSNRYYSPDETLEIRPSVGLFASRVP